MRFTAKKSTVGIERVEREIRYPQKVKTRSSLALSHPYYWTDGWRRSRTNPPLTSISETNWYYGRERERRAKSFETHHSFDSKVSEIWLQEPHQSYRTEKWYFLLLSILLVSEKHLRRYTDPSFSSFSQISEVFDSQLMKGFIDFCGFCVFFLFD